MLHVLMVSLTFAAIDPRAARLAERAEVLAKAGKLSDAKTKLQEARQLAATEPAIAYNLGEVCDVLGDRSCAVDAYNTYLKLLPSAPDSADVRERIARLEVALIPEGARDRLEKGNAFVKYGRWQDAESEYKAAAGLAPIWSVPWYNLGLMYESLDRLDDAIAAFQKDISLSTEASASSIRSRLVELEARQSAEKARAEQQRRQLEEDEAERRQANMKAEELRLAQLQADKLQGLRITCDDCGPGQAGEDLTFSFRVIGPDAHGKSIKKCELSGHDACVLHFDSGPVSVRASSPQLSWPNQLNLELGNGVRDVLVRAPWRAPRWPWLIVAAGAVACGAGALVYLDQSSKPVLERDISTESGGETAMVMGCGVGGIAAVVEIIMSIAEDTDAPKFAQ